jgi:hypothetical protein
MSFRSRSLFVLALALAVPAGGCLPHQGDTKMARGEAFTSGDPKYDEFFQSVLDAKSKVEDIDGARALRKTLAEGLESTKESQSNDDLFAAAKSKADSTKEGGGAFYVQFLPKAKLYKRGKAEADKFSKAVEKTVEEGISKSDEYAGLALQFEQLEGKVEGLIDGAGEAFKDPKKKDEVVAELEAAKDVLEQARMKALAESGRALNFVVELARNVDTGGADAVAIAEVTPPAPTAKPYTGPGKGGGHPVSKGTDFDH